MNKGYNSLLAAVQKDAAAGQNCFNPGGCDHEFYRNEHRDGKTVCLKVSKCFHKYCDRFKFATEMVSRYSKLSGIREEHIFDCIERRRTYSYMNFYQNAELPENGEKYSLEEIVKSHFEVVESEHKVNALEVSLKRLPPTKRFKHPRDLLVGALMEEQKKLEALRTKVNWMEIMSKVYHATHKEEHENQLV